MRKKDESTAKRFAIFLAASVVIGAAGALVGYLIPENHPDDQIQNTVVLGLTLFAFAMLVLYLFSLIRRRVLSRWNATLLFLIPFLTVFLFWCAKGGYGQLGAFTICAMLGIGIHLAWKMNKALRGSGNSEIG